jgi:hypothetical protein
MLSAPPAVLPPALAARYPNGVEVSGVTLRFDASGNTTGVTSGATPPMREAVAAWGKGVRFAPLSYDCPPRKRQEHVSLDDVDFFPQSSGVVGFPRNVGGVDFDNRAYSGGPGNCKHVTLNDGKASSPEGEYEAYVQDLFAGAVGGATVAVAVLRCEYNGHGFDALAQVFVIASGSARLLDTIGSGGMAGSDSVMPPWPGGWFHVSFRNGMLYADVWDQSRQCDRNRDWTSTSYALTNGKLVALSTTPHHRAGLALACAR